MIGSNCCLYSCTIGNDVVIGDGSVILEGAKVEDGAHVAPGSVVPPGRLIPTKQMWGGNPVSFIKDLNVAETWSNYSKSYVHHHLGEVHKEEFSVWNAAYLDLPAYEDDFDVDELSQSLSVVDMERGCARNYA